MSASSAPLPALRVVAAVSLLAAATLGFQLCFTRHLSFLYWHHFAFMIIGIGMLGFGAAGAWLARGGGVVDGAGAHRRAALAALAAGVAALAYLLVGPLVALEPLRLLDDPDQFVQLLALYLLMLAVFTPLGLAQGALIAGYRAHAHRIYGADLLGAGIGCGLALGLLGLVSATTAILLLGALAAAAGSLLGWDQGRGLRLGPGAAAVLLALLAASGWSDRIAFRPAPSKDISAITTRDPAADPIEYRTSSATMRIDVTRPFQGRFGFGGEVASDAAEPAPQMPMRAVFQDGAAPTALFDLPDPAAAAFLGRTNQSLAYQIRERPRVCVIGAGGGPDLLIALHHGARSVTAVELNPEMMELGRERYRDFVGGLFQRQEVTPVVSEGRHFLARTSEQFDVVQMSGVDTFAALASGAYAMSENYLYTVEAGQAVLRVLSDDGLFTNSRWSLDPPRETLRVVNVLAESLRREGADDPARHLFAIRGARWGTTLMSKRPFRDEELAVLRQWSAARGFQIVLDPNGSGLAPFVALIHAAPDEREAFLREYPYEVGAIDDDRPFFFEFYRWRNLLQPPRSTGGYVITRMPVGYAVLAASLLQMALLAAVCIVGPLWPQRAGLRGQPHLLRRLGYFAALGAGFMAIEVTALQMFTVFLGAPIYSMAITLSSLLVATGLGSLWAGTRKALPSRLVGGAVIGIALWAGLSSVAIRELLAATIALPLPGRAALVAIWLLPVGLCLGIPMPTALRALARETPALVPWAWGANACASVLASVAVVLLSMQIGFRGTLLVSACVYALGYWIWRPTLPAAPR